MTNINECDLDEMKASVARGAAMLDVVEPGWVDVIYVDELDMSEIDLCIMGQLSGLSYGDGLEMYGLELEDGFKYGFEAKIPPGADSAKAVYADLKAMWVEAIAMRRLAKTLAT